MVALPKPESSTVRAIYQAYEDANQHYDSLGISVGEIGTECDRSLFYTLRWSSEPETMTGKTLRLFETGNIEEERLVADLEAIGVTVTGQQDRIRLAAGHIRGKCDGKAIGVPEAPKTEHLLEFKSANDKNFNDIQKKGCKASKPLHYAQCQIGCHAFGLTRALYVVVNKNSDELYAERIEYDFEYCARQIARVERLVRAHEPPSRISEDPEFFGCMFCKHHAVCHEQRFARVSCRSCLHSTPEMSGDAHWSCSRWSKPLSVDEQKQACPAHLHLPGLVPGEVIATDEERETVTYKLTSGKIWVDGESKEESEVEYASI